VAKWGERQKSTVFFRIPSKTRNKNPIVKHESKAMSGRVRGTPEAHGLVRIPSKTRNKNPVVKHKSKVTSGRE